MAGLFFVRGPRRSIVVEPRFAREQLSGVNVMSTW